MTKKQNISTMFLLPGIQIKPDLKRKFYDNGFVNTYLTCSPYKYPYPVLFLLFQPIKLDHAFNEFTTELRRNKNFIEILDAGSNKVIIVYRIPKIFTKDYQTFLEGKYSKLSKDFKSCFAMEDYVRNPKTGAPQRGPNGKFEKEATTFYHVFNRTDIMKGRWRERLGYAVNDPILDDIELYQKQDEEKETLLIDETW